MSNQETNIHDETLEEILRSCKEDPFGIGSPVINIHNAFAKSSVGSVETINAEPIKDSKLPIIIGGPVPADYKEIVDRWLQLYKKLPQVDFDKTYDELGLLSVESSKTPTLQHLNDQLQRVQSAKDRLAEILKDVLLVHSIKKRALDVLRDSWGRFTTERNAESRKGDSVVRVSDFERDYAEIEALLKSCNHILKNLDSLHENLSRRVSIMQLELKLYDFSRTSLPDFEFSKNATNDFDSLLSDKKDFDPNEPQLPEAVDF